MSGNIILIIFEFAFLGLVVVLLFARLSFSYARMYREAPEASKEFQDNFTKVQADLGRPESRPEVSYRPLEQLKNLAALNKKYAANPKARAAINRVIWDLRFTLGWLAVCGLLGLSTVIALF